MFKALFLEDKNVDLDRIVPKNKTAIMFFKKLLVKRCFLYCPIKFIICPTKTILTNFLHINKFVLCKTKLNKDLFLKYFEFKHLYHYFHKKSYRLVL